MDMWGVCRLSCRLVRLHSLKMRAIGASPLSIVMERGLVVPYELSQRAAATGRCFRRNSRTCRTASWMCSWESFQG
jgi:hypothetical protein